MNLAWGVRDKPRRTEPFLRNPLVEPMVSATAAHMYRSIAGRLQEIDQELLGGIIHVVSEISEHLRVHDNIQV
jgi:hypothetical protein